MSLVRPLVRSLTRSLNRGVSRGFAEPIHRWTFDEGTGNTAADTGSLGDADATRQTNATWRSEAKVGANSFTAGGAADAGFSVTGQDSFKFSATDDFTIMFWVRYGSLPGAWEGLWQAGTDGGNRNGVFCSPSNTINFAGNGGSFSGSIVLPPNAWTHVCVVQSTSANLRYIYINGVEDATNGTLRSGDGVGDLFIGTRTASATEAGSASIDDVRVYDVALTPSQIRGIIAPTPAFEPALKAWWPLTENELEPVGGLDITWNGGTPTYSASGATGNGTIYGRVVAGTALNRAANLPVTVAGWYEPETVGSFNYGWSMGPTDTTVDDETEFKSGSDDLLDARIVDGGYNDINPAGVVVAGTPYHIALIYDPDDPLRPDSRCFVNGALVTQTTVDRDRSFNANFIYFLTLLADTTPAGTATAKDLRIYHRALKEIEVIRLYEEGIEGLDVDGSFEPIIFQESAGQVVMEAIHMSINGEGNESEFYAWEPRDDITIDPPSHMQANTGSGFSAEGEGPYMEYNIDFTTTGNYYLHPRTGGASGSNDSLFARIGKDGVWQSWVNCSLPASGSWQWDTSNSLIGNVDEAGVWQLQIARRERSVTIAKIILTTNSSLLETGNGPAESPRV